MITAYFLQIITSFLAFITPEVLTSLPSAFYDKVTPFLSFVAPLDYILPVHTLFTFLMVLIIFEVGLIFFKLIYHLIPTT